MILFKVKYKHLKWFEEECAVHKYYAAKSIHQLTDEIKRYNTLNNTNPMVIESIKRISRTIEVLTENED